MGDSLSGGGGSRFLNPWVLHFQKMGLELKCPLWCVLLIYFFSHFSLCGWFWVCSLMLCLLAEKIHG
jgi:hypothetical protein